MLKTLRITSLIAVVLAVCGVLFIIYLGLKKDPDITAYLDNPGAVGKFKDQVKDGDKKELDSPLVTQAHLFALRINPPAPPKPPKPVEPIKPKEPVVADGNKREKPTPPPPPPPPTNTKFTLLATVMCESNPKRSMVLLRQAGNKDEWFWQGDKVGLMEVEDVRDGSAVFSQSGRNKQELFVPVKPEGKSLLKNDATASRVPSGPGSITTQLGATSESPATAVTAGQTDTASATASRTGRIDRSRTTSASSDEARKEVADRIRRIRTVPAPPTPAEQKASLQESISSIQQIMNREDSSISEEQRKQENETWMKLLEALQGEKAKIPEVETPQPAAKDAPAEAQDKTSQADDEGQAETVTPPQDPNEE